jgi:polysaccharide export outer membrane protein
VRKITFGFGLATLLCFAVGLGGCAATDTAAAPAPAAVGASAGLASPAGATGADDTNPDLSQPRTAEAGAIAESPNDYVIGPGDVLSIFVYQAPPLSVGELPVRPDGRISVPLVPDVMAAGKTPTQLGSEIAAKLKKYVNDPNVTVMVHSFQGPADRQVRVIGEAADPQAIPYRENMTVLDVMIATKGLTKFAAGNRAVIVRHEGAKEERIRVHLSDLIKDGDISQNVQMRPGDTLIIPQSYF